MSNDEIKQFKNEIQVLKERIEALEKLNEELVEQNEELREENDHHAEMLAFLPADAKKQMNSKRKTTSSLRYKMVTVMYSDVKGFTQLSKEQDAEALIDELDNFFFKFDEVVEKHNIQKVKSIGDTYMCAGGIPKKNRTNPVEVIMAALEMQAYLKKNTR
jgi:adenylate cyclase